MAADFIVVNRAKQQGALLVNLADQLRALRELTDKLKDNANHQNENGDFSMMESLFGLETGKGANVTTLINILDNILNGSGDVSGATRIGQIEEFVSRLAGQ